MDRDETSVTDTAEAVETIRRTVYWTETPG